MKCGRRECRVICHAKARPFLVLFLMCRENTCAAGFLTTGLQVGNAKCQPFIGLHSFVSFLRARASSLRLAAQALSQRLNPHVPFQPNQCKLALAQL